MPEVAVGEYSGENFHENSPAVTVLRIRSSNGADDSHVKMEQKRSFKHQNFRQGTRYTSIARTDPTTLLNQFRSAKQG